jgi:hypothetical protein
MRAGSHTSGLIDRWVASPEGLFDGVPGVLPAKPFYSESFPNVKSSPRMCT